MFQLITVYLTIGFYFVMVVFIYMLLWFVWLGTSVDSKATIDVPKNHLRGIDCFSCVLCFLIEIVKLHVNYYSHACVFPWSDKVGMLALLLLSWNKAKLSIFLVVLNRQCSNQ